MAAVAYESQRLKQQTGQVVVAAANVLIFDAIEEGAGNVIADTLSNKIDSVSATKCYVINKL